MIFSFTYSENLITWVWIQIFCFLFLIKQVFVFNFSLSKNLAWWIYSGFLCNMWGLDNEVCWLCHRSAYSSTSFLLTFVKSLPLDHSLSIIISSCWWLHITNIVPMSVNNSYFCMVQGLLVSMVLRKWMGEELCLIRVWDRKQFEHKWLPQRLLNVAHLHEHITHLCFFVTPSSFFPVSSQR